MPRARSTDRSFHPPPWDLHQSLAPDRAEEHPHPANEVAKPSGGDILNTEVFDHPAKFFLRNSTPAWPNPTLDKDRAAATEARNGPGPVLRRRALGIP